MFVSMLFCLSLFLCPGIFSEQTQFTLQSTEERPLVDFIIIGAQKAGTTALHQMLREHPQLCMGSKEVHYFDRHYKQGSNRYAKMLPQRKNADQLVGEKTPAYLFHPKIPKRTFSLAPEVKLLIILRNPVDRAYSHYWHNQRMQIESQSFEEAISAEWMQMQEKNECLPGDSEQTASYPQHAYLSRGLYLDQIKRWLAFFPREQMLILSSSDLKNHENETLNKVFNFLKIPPYPVKTSEKLERKYPPIDPETRKQLITFFEPFNQELEEFLGMQFNWK